MQLKIFVFRIFIMKFNQFCSCLGCIACRRAEWTATLSHAFILRILKSRWWGSIEMRKLCNWIWIQNVYSRKWWVDFNCVISMSRNSKPLKLYCYSEYGPGCIIWYDDWDCKLIPILRVCINILIFSNLRIYLNSI